MATSQPLNAEARVATVKLGHPKVEVPRWAPSYDAAQLVRRPPRFQKPAFLFVLAAALSLLPLACRNRSARNAGTAAADMTSNNECFRELVRTRGSYLGQQIGQSKHVVFQRV